MATYASIWAQDRNGVIGDGHRMLWHVPADFKFFKAQTSGCPVIMGRASFEALGHPLPNRDNVVLTRDLSFTSPGITVVHSIPEAWAVAGALAERRGADTVWIAGGADVYAQTLGEVDRLVVTYLDLTVEAGGVEPQLLKAPPIDPQIWRLVEPLSDVHWRPHSGDAPWKVAVYERR